MRPFITIVIPAYNRERVIGRAIGSCLSQSDGDFEVIVVDDGSRDKTVEVAESFDDERVVVLRHDKNRGVGPARNTGVAAARAPWVLPLDSDDELTPDAIATIRTRLAQVPAEIDALFFRCVTDAGVVSPTVNTPLGQRDYAAYLGHLNANFGKMRDSSTVCRRETFDRLRYPDSFGWEEFYWVEFNKLFSSWVFDDVIRLYHQDAGDQLVKMINTDSARRNVVTQNDRASELAQVVAQHGAQMAIHAPLILREYAFRLLYILLSLGERRRASKFVYEYARIQRPAPAFLGIFLLGLCGPNTVARVKALVRKISVSRLEINAPAKRKTPTD
ncbi:glycosyltransferase family 2 protein [Oryzibacter oryziterrae]|uniref:glycosyltransferase family 2 protein n=1 Tax=Oryzibacter oryziterrae TaxID=2766474 RepID=UPI001F35E4FF|nr:glycosyltransferase family 2 protein [Oryzibacter oryziterrae]